MNATDLLLDLTQSEVDIIRLALRERETNLKRQGFRALEQQVAELRDKISSAIIDNNRINA